MIKVKVKVAEASGMVLGYMAALALGGTEPWFDTVNTFWIKIDGKDRAFSTKWSDQQNFAPATLWAHGGPIIEQLRSDSAYQLLIESDGDNVHVLSWPSAHVHFSGYGPTILIAALRCFITSKLGEEVEVPAELLEAQP